MDIQLVDPREGNVIARGSYYGGPDYEFVVQAEGIVYFRVVGDEEHVWAGPNEHAFRRIVRAWQQCESEIIKLTDEAARIARINQLRLMLSSLGAIPDDLPEDPGPLWSLLLFEAENGLG